MVHYKHRRNQQDEGADIAVAALPDVSLDIAVPPFPGETVEDMGQDVEEVP